MANVKCPYCTATRSSQDALTLHVDMQHQDVSVARRTLDLRNPQQVKDVNDVNPPLTIESSDTSHVVRCVCGELIEPFDDDTEYPGWTHVFALGAALRPAGKCTDAIPSAGMPTKADRANLDKALAQTSVGLAEAGREMAEMRAALDAVDERMQKLDAQLISPAKVRRATLNQVWDKLLDSGDLAGAAIVMKMIDRVVND